MEKKIQINMSTFLDVYRLVYGIDVNSLDLNSKEIIKRLEIDLNAKLDAMQRREAYTQSKTAETEEEKEKARQKYLDLAGIHKDFRYSSDFNNSN